MVEVREGLSAGLYSSGCVRKVWEVVVICQVPFVWRERMASFPIPQAAGCDMYTEGVRLGTTSE